MDDRWLLLDRPLFEILQDIAAVTSIRFWTYNESLAFELLRDHRCIAQANRITDQNYLGQCFGRYFARLPEGCSGKGQRENGNI